MIDVGCGSGDSAKLLLDQWPNAKLTLMDSCMERLEMAKTDEALRSRSLVTFLHEDANEHFSYEAASSGEMYDLVFSNAALHWSENVPQLAMRLLARVRPGGSLALQIPSMAEEPSHQLFKETAASMGLTDDSIRLPTNNRHPIDYANALLGPMCASLDMWETTYVHVLEGKDPVYSFVRETFDGRRQAGAWREALQSKLGDQKAEEFEEAYRKSVAQAYPHADACGSTTLYPFKRFFLVATRPGLLD